MDKNTNLEKGQSIILITILFFAFIALLALVLDGGYTYYLRRNAQNAADAGALAGADELCYSKNEDTAQTVATNITEDNMASVAPGFRSISALAHLDEDNSGGTVEVQTSITYQTFFGRLLGSDTVRAPARAVAGCGPGAGVGVLPVAWSCRYPDDPESSGSKDCEIQYMTGSDCEIGKEPMYIVVDTATIEEEILCQDPPNSGAPVGALDCDLDNVLPFENDVEPLSGGNRSWLDLDGKGSAAKLMEWVENGYYIEPHTWYAGQTGVADSVYQAVDEFQYQNDVIIPVFDMYCPHYPGAPCTIHDEDEIVKTGGTSQDYFHVITFASFHVECIDAPGTKNSPKKCPVHTALDLPNNVFTIEGCFVKGFAQMPAEPGQGIDSGVYTVFMIE